MGFHRVFADEELFRDLAVAEPRGNELQDLQLPSCDAELFQFAQVSVSKASSRTTGTSLMTTVSRGRVSFRPSQIPRPAKVTATSPP